MKRTAGAWIGALALVPLIAGVGHAQVRAASTLDNDVSSPDAIVAALYDVISGPAGQARDWDRFRRLFLPDAGRLIGMAVNPQGQIVYYALPPDGYVERSGQALERNGFFEHEIGSTEERFGNMVHRFSAYAARRSLDDPEPFMRGINSIQLLFDGSRWWVVSVLWDQERPDNRIPEHMIGNGPDRTPTGRPAPR